MLWNRFLPGPTRWHRWWYITTSGSCPLCWKCASMVNYTTIYTLLRKIAFKAITFVTIKYVFRNCSRLQRYDPFYDLQNFTLEICIEKLEVDVMVPSRASEAQVIQWQCCKKNNCHVQLTIIGEILQNNSPWGKLPPLREYHVTCIVVTSQYVKGE